MPNPQEQGHFLLNGKNLIIEGPLKILEDKVQRSDVKYEKMVNKIEIELFDGLSFLQSLFIILAWFAKLLLPPP